MTVESMIWLHELFCLALLYSIFCRAVHSCERVRTDVRFAFFLLGIVACAGLSAPLTWHFVPDFFTLALLASMTVVQLVTAHHWSAGVPDRFYKPGCVPRRRRSSDKERS